MNQVQAGTTLDMDPSVRFSEYATLICLYNDVLPSVTNAIRFSEHALSNQETVGMFKDTFHQQFGNLYVGDMGTINTAKQNELHRIITGNLCTPGLGAMMKAFVKALDKIKIKLTLDSSKGPLVTLQEELHEFRKLIEASKINKYYRDVRGGKFGA